MYLWQKKLSVLTLGCVMCLSGTTSADAGIIPWAYNVVFGPPGSWAAMRQARMSGYYGGYAPYGYGAAPAYYGGDPGACGPCGQAQSAYYAPAYAMAPACSTCNTCTSGCSTGNCSTGGCASGNCSVNYGSDASTGESSDAAGLEKADDKKTFEKPPELPMHGEGDGFGPAGGNEGYDDNKGADDAEKWPPPVKEEANKIPALESGEDEIIKKRKPAPTGDGASSSAPVLQPVDVKGKVAWRVAPSVNRSVRIARYSIPSVVRVQKYQSEFRVLVPEVDHQIASK